MAQIFDTSATTTASGIVFDFAVTTLQAIPTTVDVGQSIMLSIDEDRSGATVTYFANDAQLAEVTGDDGYEFEWVTDEVDTFTVRAEITDAGSRQHRTQSVDVVVEEVGGEPEALLLDEYPNAQAAYSLNRLASGYEGDAIRVRRMSDEEETDIGFDGNAIDESALLSFADGGDLRLATWYDQTGGDNHFTPDDPNEGFLIVEDGELTKDRLGQVALRSSGGYMTAPIAPEQLDFALYADFDWLGSRGSSSPIMYGTNTSANTPGAWALRGNRVRYYDPDTDNNRTTTNFTGSSIDLPGIWSMRMNDTYMDIRHNEIFMLEQYEHSGGGGQADVTQLRYEDGDDGLEYFIGTFVIYDWIEDTENSEIESVLNNGHFYDGPVNEQAIMPQDFSYQVELYDWLETLTVADVESPMESISYTSGASEDEIYPLEISLRDAVPNHGLRFEAKHFVLDDGAGNGYEGDGENVRLPRRDHNSNNVIQSQAGWWARLDLPGLTNPYLDNDNIKRRLLSVSAVEMIMVGSWYLNNSPSRPDYAMSYMYDVAYAFYYFHDVLDADTQDAFLDGFEQILLLVQGEGYPHNVNTNMDLKGVAATAYMSKTGEVTGRTSLEETARDLVRKWLLGGSDNNPDTADAYERSHQPEELDEGPGERIIFHSAGYIGERSGPETTYNGIGRVYMNIIAGLVNGNSDWEWYWGADGVMDRMARFKIYQHFPEPDGRYDGPSSFSKRTNGPMVRDQWQSDQRDALEALISDNAKPLLRSPRGGSDLFPMPLSDMESSVTSTLDSRDFTQTEPDVTTWSGWTQAWRRPGNGSFLDHYVPGTHDAFKALDDNNDDVLDVPWERGESFNEAFGRSDMPPEFWAFKDNDGSQDFGFFVSSVEAAGRQYTRGYKAGGMLQTFWTENTGSVVMARLPGFFNSTESGWENMETWPVAHVWGEHDDGELFTNAETRYAEVTDETQEGTPRIIKDIAFRKDGSSWGDFDQMLEIEATALSNGLQMKHTITSPGTEQITELWGSIPVNLRESSSQASSSETQIEYWDGSEWQTLTTTPVSAQYVRLGRDWGGGAEYVYIDFDEPHDLKLSSEVFDQSNVSGSSQGSARTRNIHVDLHGNPGTAQSFPSNQSLTYAFLTSDPTS